MGWNMFSNAAAKRLRAGWALVKINRVRFNGEKMLVKCYIKEKKFYNLSIILAEDCIRRNRRRNAYALLLYSES